MSKASLPNDIAQLLANGDINAADRRTQAFCVQQPNAPGGLHARGLIALLAGDHQQAAHWLELAEPLAAHDPQLLCNLASAYLKDGRFREAETLLRRALTIRPGYDKALFNLGCAILANGDTSGAGELFEGLMDGEASDVEHAEYCCSRGDAARQEGRWYLAMGSYRKALKTNPDHARAASNLGALLVSFGNSDEAREFCLKAVALAPDNYLTHHNLGRCLSHLECFDEAMSAYADAYELAPDSAILCAEIAGMWLTSGDLAEASTWYQRALELEPELPTALAGLARSLLAGGFVTAALQSLQQALQKFPEDFELIRAYADALWDDGDVAGALTQMARLRDLQPENAALLAHEGQMLASAGQVSEALKKHLEALALNPRCIPALHGLASRKRQKLDVRQRNVMRKLLRNRKLADTPRATLHNALAYWHDGRREWQRAARHMEKANALQWDSQSKRSWDYDRDHHRTYCNRLIASFNADWLDQRRHFGLDSMAPVFIVGMPRSATTLTEQILARHPQALGIGERNFAARSMRAVAMNFAPGGSDSEDTTPLQCVRRLPKKVVRKAAQVYLAVLEEQKQHAQHGNAIRVIDKMPDNYSLLGWILTLFPRARVIHCRRDLRDVALSCWLTQFGKIQWASRMADLTARIEDYRRVMDHWRKVLPGRFLEIDYESLVTHQETETRRLLDWIELPWDDDCMRFYESDRVIRTASITQVREPIYTGSIGRWKPYEPYLPQIAALESA